MMGYKDMTFCISPDCKNDCKRKLTKEIAEAADKWWGQGPDQAPIACSYFCGGEPKNESQR